jgi:hypothetical protein
MLKRYDFGKMTEDLVFGVAMTVSSTKKKAHRRVLEACPFCIYCGGEVQAVSIDHVPPRVMFRGKHRPKGLEFASCKCCNEGTGHADLVAALLGRVATDASDEEEKVELEGLLGGVSNNVPGLLEEMGFPDTHLKANGPLVRAHMQTFATKIGFALYYALTKKIVPMNGGVAARWFSNVDHLEGAFPQSAFEHLLPRMTLKQGRFEVSDQFGYQWRLAEGDRMALFLAAFRQSFTVLAFVTTDVRLFDIETKHPMQIVRPRNIMKLLRSATQESQSFQ